MLHVASNRHVLHPARCFVQIEDKRARREAERLAEAERERRDEERLARQIAELGARELRMREAERSKEQRRIEVR